MAAPYISCSSLSQWGKTSPDQSTHPVYWSIAQSCEQDAPQQCCQIGLDLPPNLATLAGFNHVDFSHRSDIAIDVIYIQIAGRWIQKWCHCTIWNMVIGYKESSIVSWPWYGFNWILHLIPVNMQIHVFGSIERAIWCASGCRLIRHFATTSCSIKLAARQITQHIPPPR